MKRPPLLLLLLLLLLLCACVLPCRAAFGDKEGVPVALRDNVRLSLGVQGASRAPLATGASASAASAKVCAPVKGTWHAMIIWGHGLQHGEAIWEAIHAVDGVHLFFQKEVRLPPADASNQVSRFVHKHQHAGDDAVRVLVMYDAVPTVKVRGKGARKFEINERMSKLKWDLRKRFNPKLPGGGGKPSHDDVVFISNSGKGVDALLKYMQLPSTGALVNSHHEFFTPWHIGAPASYGVRDVDLRTLIVGCATSVGACGKKDKRVAGPAGGVLVPDSAHFAFASGRDPAEYASHYRTGVDTGALTDDHTPGAFTALQRKFDTSAYPACVCGFDGILRRSMIVVKGQRIYDGAHRAAIMLAANGGKATTVKVVDIALSGGHVEGCGQNIVGNHIRKNLPPGEHRVTGVCIVSDRMRLIFIKTAKSAGSTVLLGWIRPSLCPPKNASDTFRGWGTTKLHKQLGNAFSKSCDETIVFPRPGVDAAPCASVPKWKWRQYFVITTIRNPYSRMRSSFAYCKPALKWGEFCEDPQSSGDTCRGVTEVHNIHYRFPVHWAYHSWWGWHIDYAIRTEAMAAGIAEVAAIVNARAAARGEPLRLMNKAVSINVNPNEHPMAKPAAEKKKLCAWYSGEHAHCAAALERMADPMVLGYADHCADSATKSGNWLK